MQHCNTVMVVGDLVPTEVQLLQLGQGLEDGEGGMDVGMGGEKAKELVATI